MTAAVNTALGSVYEGLLEQQPRLQSAGERPTFALVVSGERKTTGSYYTNPGLVRELIRSALEPAIAGALARGTTTEEQRRNLLALKVCDPACGSGHFLLAAARRIGRALAEVEAGGNEPTPDQERAAVREAIGHCVYGVDLNLLAVDLCKVALWLEGQHAGKPLQFLDHHLRHGNSLIGATTAAMAEGVPDAAYDPVTGDNKTYAATIKRRNRAERTGQRTLEDAGWQVTDVSDEAARRRYFASLAAADETLAGVAMKELEFYRHQRDPEVLHRKLTADLWTAAFFWPLGVGEANPPTDGVWRRLAAAPDLVDYLDRRKTAELQGRADFRTVRATWDLARTHRFFHWELEFEDVFSRPDPGFDVILGNPPWERIKLQEQEFFAQRDPAIAAAPNAAARKRLIAALPETDPPLFAAYQRAKRESEAESKFLRESGRYPLTGRGDINTYSVFSETNTEHVRDAGRAGIIVPTGIATDDTNKVFFAALVDHRRLVSLFDFENREGLFPSVDSRYKFSLLTTGQPRHPDGAFDAAFFLTQPAQFADPERVFTLTPEEIALLNPNTRTAPIFRNRRDAEITKRLYRAAPVLVREGPETANPWGVTFQRVFDMNRVEVLALCSQQMSSDASTRMYEAKLFHQYDHRWATYEGISTRDVNQQDKRDARCLVQTRYYLPRGEVVKRHPAYWNADWLVAYRDIARNTDERTVISSVLPFSGTDMTVRLVLPTTPPTLTACVLANLNTLTLDFASRQKLSGTHLSDYLVKQLPVLPPETYTPVLLDLIVPRVLELVYTAWDLEPFARDLGYEGEPFRWDEARRALLRAELDGLYAHLYGLDRDDFAYILDQFPIVRRKDQAAFGEFRTKRLCLEAYDFFSKGAREKLRTAVEEVEIALTHCIVARLGDDLARAPEEAQAALEAERI
jgi:hypothetical protein